MTDGVFAEARRRVSAREVAELNGLHPNRSEFICCPFHREKTPSLKFFTDGGWKCFGCGKGGSSIDFVAALYDLTPLEAVRRLNDDFRLNLPLDRQQTPAERREAEKAAQRRRELADTAQLFEAWRNSILDKLTAVFRMAHLALKNCQNLDALTEAEALAVKWQAAAEFWADCLMFGSMETQMEIFRDRRDIEARCEMILRNMPMKSGAA